MAESAQVSTVRAGVIHYTHIKGDTWAPPPVTFESRATDEDPWTPEDFSGAALKMQVRDPNNKRLLKELTDGDGITVTDNALQYLIDADDMEEWPQGIYRYDVQKTIAGIRSTIQKGSFTIIDETTTE